MAMCRNDLLRLGSLLAAVVVAPPGCGPPANEKMTRQEVDEVLQNTSRLAEDPQALARYFAAGRGKELAEKRLRGIFGARSAALLRGATRIEAFRIVDSEGVEGFPSRRAVGRKLGSIDGYTITAEGRE